ncbi:hypothetical protein [Sphingomonas sp. MMS24-J13]|uniref:hypothetical protein n=1 Tax=Sphingomonas sp. MMS24-J13 TaxID=3238686 RepID=UPI00384DED7D
METLLDTDRLPRPATIRTAAADAAWLAHRYHPGEDVIHLLPVPRSLHRRVTFLTDEYLPRKLEPLIVRRVDAMAGAPAPAPLHFVFHSAFCCSTVLARAFDRPGWAMGLKEPIILNDIVGWKRRGDPGPDMATVLNDVLTLLGRPFAPHEAVIVKPTNIVNGLAAAMLTLRPQANALLLHAPLKVYLGSIARKGIDGRLWVRNLLLGLLDDKLIDLGFSPRDLIGQTDLQVAAVGWLAQHALFQGLVQRFGAARVRTIDSETLMREPVAAMGSLAALYRLPLEAAELREIVDGPAFTRHSKTGDSFAADDRARDQDHTADAHADEIEKVAYWAEKVAEAAGISMALPAPLIENGSR